MGSTDVGMVVADAPLILRREDRLVLIAFVDALDAALVDGDLANAIDFGIVEIGRRFTGRSPRAMSDYHRCKIHGYLQWSGRDPDVDAAIAVMMRIIDGDVAVVDGDLPCVEIIGEN